ncbi:MAG: Gfo/Idh/MocA family oxidoreductase [Clostridia bacterium]|nr:Gfo/Idh/MocA family oxidoreductase [Clostridia bacterium]
MNVAILSAWHVHTEGYGKFINEQPDANLTVLWDDDPVRGADMAQKLGVPYEPDLDTMLKRDDVDAVLCCAPTTEHCPLLIKCAQAGKHIFTEKALAPTVEECKAIAKAVQENGVKFVISHPHLSEPGVEYAKQAIDQGLLGKVTYFRMRTAHDGSSGGWLPDYWYDLTKAGGGAMMDLGCHPNYTAAYLMGKPKKIASIFNSTYAPQGEDNAVSVIEFESGAIGVLETGFVTPFSRSPIEIQGTEGSITIQGGKVSIRSKKLGVDGTVIVEKLPAARPAPLRQWIDAVEHGADIFLDMNKAIALTELLENEYKAAEGGKTVCL